MVALAGLAASPALAAPDKPQAQATAVDGNWKLDGRLDEPFWAGLPVHRVSHVVGKNAPPASNPDATTFRVALRGQTLLVGVTCVQPASNVVAVATQRNLSTVCNDDSVEVFLGLDDLGQYQFAVNTIGTLYEGYIPVQLHGARTLWNGAWQAAVHCGESQWTAEIAIALPALNRSPSPATDAWRFNVARTWGQERAYQSWSPVQKGFADWPHHGSLSFPDGLPTETWFDATHAQVPTLAVGRNVFTLRFDHARPGAYSVRQSLRTWTPGPLPERATTHRNLSPRDGRVDVPVSLDVGYVDGLQEWVLEVIDEKTQATVGMYVHTFRLASPLEVTTDWFVHLKTDPAIPVRVTLHLAPGSAVQGSVRLTAQDDAGSPPLTLTQPLTAARQYVFSLPTSKLKPGLHHLSLEATAGDVRFAWQGVFELAGGITLP